jgi:putative component of membrane protein insertase Oxa1/YidC/SpoIIIJ protein YidD
MFVSRTSSARKIPGLAPGIFFFALALAASAGVSLQLAEELFAEGNWSAARAEGLRAQMEAGDEGLSARARLLAAQAALRMGKGRAQAQAELEAVWRDEAAPLETRSAAAYAFGLAAWDDRDRDAAFDSLKFAFLNARAAPLFWRSGCSLYFFLKADKPLRRQEAALWQSLQSCRDAWPLEIWRECRPRKPRGTAWAARPGRWIVRFYRAAIGPAIGSRCDLQPSCSEYFLHASHAHGLLGIPVMADRFIREPSVVSAKEQPVVMPDGRIRYADPLSDHDFWMKGKK